MLGAFVVVITLHATGAVGAIAYPVVTLGGVLCGIVALRRQRPELSWPWWSLIAAGLVWTAAGVVRAHTGSTGVLTPERSLLPDAFALPGYVVFGIGLYGLLKTRTSTVPRDVAADCLMVGMAASLALYELLLAPTLERADVWFLARLAIVVYPVASVFLLAIAARLAFTGDGHSVAFSLVMIGTAFLLAGDVVFAIGEIGSLPGVPERVLEVPYLLVPACIGSALLDRSSSEFRAAATASRSELTVSRRLVVGLSLLAPVFILLSDGVSEAQVVSIVLCVVLAMSAVGRVAGLMRSQAESRSLLAHQATHDELTGLPGRHLLAQRADLLLVEGARTVSLLFIDLDRFKLVNDSMGHAAGDELLVRVADRLRSTAPDPITVARVSGDEFLVLVPDVDTGGALAVAERFREVLAERFELSAGVEVFVSASIGIAIARPGEHTDATTLIREADAAMYQAKDAGRDAVTVFDTSMRDRIERRVELERGLRAAIAAQEIGVVYQPVVSWPDRRVRGMEALARWSHDGTPVSPIEFIDIAEESGLIDALGAFVLDEALRQVAWLRANVASARSMYASVNLSSRQIQSGEIVDIAAEALERHGLPGSALFLEITETVMVGDTVAATAALSGLSALGIRLAVDDFGTGFSSLSYLKRFPIDVVKIDRAFVSGLGHSESDASLVAAIIGMAEALGLATIAEGVETHEQARRLGELGCGNMQGYLFAKPVPISELPDAIRAISGDDQWRPTERRRCEVRPI